MKKVLGISILLVAVCAFSWIIQPKFVSAYNLENIIHWTSLYALIGIGAAFVIITGGIDLSIGSVVGMVGCLLAFLLTEAHWSVPAALFAVLFLSVFVGFLHGVLIAKMRLQPQLPCKRWQSNRGSVSLAPAHAVWCDHAWRSMLQR